MRQSIIFLVSVYVSLLAAAPAHAAPCPKDSVQVGNVCANKYEASVWEIPGTQQNVGLINKVKKGTATLTDLTSATAIVRGVVQRGATSDDYGAGCPDTGNGCVDFYAVSIPGVLPSADITWFQAAAACRNAGGRLLTNAEWQRAALGTPDPGTDNETTDCNISGPPHAVTPTGSRAACISDTGIFDAVGNVWEWVEDWVAPTACTTELFGGTGDLNCLAGQSAGYGPAALLRGGFYNSVTDAGVFAVLGSHRPSDFVSTIGFRCAH